MGKKKAAPAKSGKRSAAAPKKKTGKKTAPAGPVKKKQAKAAVGKTKTATKSTAARKAAKTAATKKPAAKKAPAARTAAKKAARKKAATRASRSAKSTPSLGRPKVTAEEKLYMLFKDDYHARQIFEFLSVHTVGELEQFAPDEIIDRLSRPIKQTVDRIRLLLASKNRALKDDRAFAHANKAP